MVHLSLKKALFSTQKPDFRPKNHKIMNSTAISRFRMISYAEGVSYLVLLGIAMPLKYMAGMPEAVKFTGWVHGLLFILYALSLAQVHFSQKWGLLTSAKAFIASLLPFGPFLFDRVVLKEKK